MLLKLEEIYSRFKKFVVAGCRASTGCRETTSCREGLQEGREGLQEGREGLLQEGAAQGKVQRFSCPQEKEVLRKGKEQGEKVQQERKKLSGRVKLCTIFICSSCHLK
jgi:hypothetical protein